MRGTCEEKSDLFDCSERKALAEWTEVETKEREEAGSWGSNSEQLDKRSSVASTAASEAHRTYFFSNLCAEPMELTRATKP